MAIKDREDFDALVQKLEASATKNPKAYVFRVAALAALGYAYIFTVLGVCLALLGVLVWIAIWGHHISVGLIKLAFVLLIFVVVIIASFFVSIPAPEGRELHPKEAPELFKDVLEIGNKLNSPFPHHVLLTNDFNASVAQVPRFGVFGWQQNYLIVGLPLLAALSPEEFKSVLGHEFGHLSGNHSKFSGKIYRLRRTWMQLVDIYSDGKDDFIFGKFFGWYAPYFSAYSFVLRRANEYVADRCAAEISGSKTAAQALTRVSVIGGFLSEKYWPSVFNRAAREAEPPAGIYGELRHAVVAPLEPATATMWLTEAIHRPMDTTDSHPSLTQRLEALGETPHWEPLTGPTAAEHYLGKRVDAFTDLLQKHWREAIGPAWKERYDQLAESRKKLDELNLKAESNPLTDEEEWQRADLTEDMGDEARALELFKEYLIKHPDNARANFTVGRLLLKEGQDEGLVYMEEAMDLDHQAITVSCQLVETYLLQRGRAEEAARFRERAFKYPRMLEAAKLERDSLHLTDIFLPHAQDEATVAAISTQVALHQMVQSAYLVQKQVQHFSRRPMLILAVEFTDAFIAATDDRDRAQALIQIWESIKSEEHLLCADLDGIQGMREKIVVVAGAEVYRR